MDPTGETTSNQGPAPGRTKFRTIKSIQNTLDTTKDLFKRHISSIAGLLKSNEVDEIMNFNADFKKNFVELRLASKDASKYYRKLGAREAEISNDDDKSELQCEYEQARKKVNRRIYELGGVQGSSLGDTSIAGDRSDIASDRVSEWVQNTSRHAGQNDIEAHQPIPKNAGNARDITLPAQNPQFTEPPPLLQIETIRGFEDLSVRDQQPLGYNSEERDFATYDTNTACQTQNTIGELPRARYTVTPVVLGPSQPPAQSRVNTETLFTTAVDTFRVHDGQLRRPLLQTIPPQPPRTQPSTVVHSQPVSTMIPFHSSQIPSAQSLNPSALAPGLALHPFTRNSEYQPPNYYDRLAASSDSNLCLLNHVRIEIMKPDPQLIFDGNRPEEFWGWHDQIERKIEEARYTQDPLQKIRVLRIHLKGRPLDILRSYADAGIRDPPRILEQILHALIFKYGSDDVISKRVTFLINSFPYISDNEDENTVDAVQDILGLCHRVRFLASRCPSLQFYTTPEGIARIWLKLPESFQRHWRSHYTRQQARGRTATFDHFIEHIEQFNAEISNPMFRKPKTKIGNRALITRPEAPIEKKTYTSTEIRDTDHRRFCLLHPGSTTHSLRDCRAFSHWDFRAKFDFAREHKLCFRCLGEHFSNKCFNSLKCDQCNRNHLTIMHSEPSSYRNQPPTPSPRSDNSYRGDGDTHNPTRTQSSAYERNANASNYNARWGGQTTRYTRSENHSGNNGRGSDYRPNQASGYHAGYSRQGFPPVLTNGDDRFQPNTNQQDGFRYDNQHTNQMPRNPPEERA